MSDSLQIPDSSVPSSAKKGYKPKSTLKPPSIQTAILAKRANGSSKAKIAKDLDIAVNTVTNVLELNDFDRNLQKEQAECLRLAPKAIRVVDQRLSKGSETAAFRLLEGIGVLGNGLKQNKPGDQGLTLAIQNLMGNVTVNQPQATETKVIDVIAEKPQEPGKCES